MPFDILVILLAITTIVFACGFAGCLLYGIYKLNEEKRPISLKLGMLATLLFSLSIGSFSLYLYLALHAL
jgi:hypothetical protein